jgi:hypothetical protein
MPLLKPDPTFYPSPRLAMQAPPEKHAFVAALNPPGSKLNDALLVVDVDPASSTYGQRVGEVRMPKFGDELHHFGWNACSSALCPYAPHPKKPDQPLAGGPQMVEVSRDGKRIYFTNSLYAAWDEQFYPDGVGSWMVKLDADPNGGMTVDKNFFVESNDYRVHQVRLEGGDSSSDSYCFP